MKKLKMSFKEEHNLECKHSPQTRSLYPISSSTSQKSILILIHSSLDRSQAPTDSPSRTRHIWTKMTAIRFSLTKFSKITSRWLKKKRIKFSAQSEASRRELSNIKSTYKNSKKPRKNSTSKMSQQKP